MTAVSADVIVRKGPTYRETSRKSQQTLGKAWKVQILLDFRFPQSFPQGGVLPGGTIRRVREGQIALRALAVQHRDELRTLAPSLLDALRHVVEPAPMATLER